MTIDSLNYLFRMDLAKDLTIFTKLLDKYQITSTPLQKAITDLKNKSYIPHTTNVEPTPLNWGYKISNFVIPINSYEGIQYPKAKNITRLKLTFDISLIGSFSEDSELIKDPYSHLEVNFIAEGFNPRDVHHIFALHLDRHIPEGNTPEDVHPIYHIQIGGRKIDNIANKNFGNSLILDSPRIMHYPMDVILAFDFLISNFSPTLYKQLRKEDSYLKLLRKSQTLILKPFVKCMSQHFSLFDEKKSGWNASQIWPQLIK